ncbi:MAG: FG-GAP-like repeat-containing protein [Thermodesulfobacteriota bacterium]|nr:FG-GAP-like repeat-containing protein [Thermodesulfobacteriota bacterium]
MKKISVFFLCLFMIISSTGSSWAKETKTIAVLPFTIHSAENIDYIKNGIWDMLISRLSATDKVEVISKSSVTETLKKTGKKDLTAGDVYGLGKMLSVDYVVWGSMTKIGNSISLDGKLLDVAAYKSPVGIFEQCRGIDEVIPKINTFAKNITCHLLGQVPPAFTPPSEPATASSSQQPVSQDSKAIATMKTPEGTYTAIINPEFINVRSCLDRRGFWKSRRYPVEFKGMDIGDVNGDGLNEVVIIDGDSVFVYQKTGTELKLIQKISGKSYVNNIAVDVADINGNGVPEIIVTSTKRSSLDSFILEFQDGKFVEIASGLRWFLRVINPSGSPLLLGQTAGIDKPFENDIHEIVWKNGKYVEGNRMLIPKGLSVYGLAVDSIDKGDRERVIALDEYDHIRIYKKTKKPVSRIHVIGGSDKMVWKSADVFGGSNNLLDMDLRGPKPSDDEVDAPENQYVNVRILTYDINKDGRKEIIIVKNLSASKRLFKNTRAFTKSEIYDLEWDGLGMVENWRTRTIQGYVADYQFKDIDNDGRNDIVLAIVLSPGFTAPKSVLVSYEMRQ